MGICSSKRRNPTIATRPGKRGIQEGFDFRQGRFIEELLIAGHSQNIPPGGDVMELHIAIFKRCSASGKMP